MPNVFLVLVFATMPSAGCPLWVKSRYCEQPALWPLSANCGHFFGGWLYQCNTAATCHQRRGYASRKRSQSQGQEAVQAVKDLRRCKPSSAYDLHWTGGYKCIFQALGQLQRSLAHRENHRSCLRVSRTAIPPCPPALLRNWTQVAGSLRGSPSGFQWQ
jgi:hypothetical protein